MSENKPILEYIYSNRMVEHDDQVLTKIKKGNAHSLICLLRPSKQEHYEVILHDVEIIDNKAVSKVREVSIPTANRFIETYTLWKYGNNLILIFLEGSKYQK